MVDKPQTTQRRVPADTFVDCVLPEPDANGWYPMRTAPQTGESVDLWVPVLHLDGGGVRVPHCHYTAGTKTHAGIQVGWREPNGSINPETRYSHWRPEPKPPMRLGDDAT